MAEISTVKQNLAVRFRYLSCGVKTPRYGGLWKACLFQAETYGKLPHRNGQPALEGNFAEDGAHHGRLRVRIELISQEVARKLRKVVEQIGTPKQGEDKRPVVLGEVAQESFLDLVQPDGPLIGSDPDGAGD